MSGLILASGSPRRHELLATFGLPFEIVVPDVDETPLPGEDPAAYVARLAEATDEENRSEDKYDMRSQSAAYLAAGQAKLATELGAAIGAYQTLALPAFGPRDAIATGALVTLEVGGEPAVYFLGPHRGGLEVVIGGQTVVVVTVASPLGRQLVGRHLGESVMLPGRTGPALQKISAVA
jgi:transcription elongation GreA/GreB family factor